MNPSHPVAHRQNLDCCVLIPARTLEDFPTDFDDSDARSTLAAWTVAWHPALIAAAKKVPSWYRADSPPEPDPEFGRTSDDEIQPTPRRLIFAPAPSIDWLPDGYQDRSQTAGAVWVTGPDRQSLLDQLAKLGHIPAQTTSLTLGNRTIDASDFYAASYAALQVEVMTRRLRYTSNLDQIHLQTRLVDAATAFLNQQTADAIAALHDVFDCLAEERDHYFSTDPYLIDLTLVVPSTLDDAAADPSIAASANAEDVNEDGANEDDGVLKTPVNVLVDADAIEKIGESSESDSDTKLLRRWMQQYQIGWAAGGVSSDVAFDLLNYPAAANAIKDARSKTAQCIGAAPRVYGGFACDTPADLIDVIATLGYQGVIPINFANGTGHQREAKVTVPVVSNNDELGGSDSNGIDALTAKPIDASSDAAFLAIGPQLGTSIDGGEIATALMVHWPGQGCDSFHDLRRIASWSLVLGRFWKIDDYFSLGEPAYHAAKWPPIGSSTLPGNDGPLNDSANPITRSADAFRQTATERQARLTDAIADLIDGSKIDGSEIDNDPSPTRIAKSVGLDATDTSGQCKLLINSLSIPSRLTANTSVAPVPSDHVYSSGRDTDDVGQESFRSQVDVPAMGYALVGPHSSNHATSSKTNTKTSVGRLGGWMRNRLLGRGRGIADGMRLQNEFMEVAISDKFAGIAGVYSGAARGNRFSMRLVAKSESIAGDSEIRCDRVRVLHSSPTNGQIEATGRLFLGDTEMASFANRFSLDSGSRLVHVDVDLTLNPSVQFSEDVWRECIASRVAVPEEASICRALIRDKVHRTQRRKMLAPLGLVVDEADRQTLITSDGYPLHQRLGERFYDTLLMVRGQANHRFRLRYGFDVTQPVATAWSGLVPTTQTSVAANFALPATGWFASVAPRDVVVSDMAVRKSTDGKLELDIELIATRGKTCTAKLQFFRDPTSARSVLPPASFAIEENVIRIPMRGHQVRRVVVSFNASSDAKSDEVSA